jgi:hypothetical protein
MEQFYEMEPDDVGAWSLGDPEDETGRTLTYWTFAEGRKWLGDELKADLKKPGWIPDITLAGPNVPIVKIAVGDVLAKFAGDTIQRIPLVAPTQKYQFELINTLSVTECLDERRSGEVVRWAAGEQPANAGRYRRVVGIKIHENKASALNIFRIKHWEVPLLVSNDLCKALMKAGLRGVSFTPL